MSASSDATVPVLTLLVIQTSQRNPLLAQPPHQIRIIRGPNSMSDPFGPYLGAAARIDSGPAVSPACAVNRRSRISGVRECLAQRQVQVRQSRRLRSQTKSRHPLRTLQPAAPLPSHMLRPKLANSIQIPPNLHREFSFGLPLRFANGLPHGIEVKSAPQHGPPPRA